MFILLAAKNKLFFQQKESEMSKGSHIAPPARD